jgi:hypothetical protein
LEGLVQRGYRVRRKIEIIRLRAPLRGLRPAAKFRFRPFDRRGSLWLGRPEVLGHGQFRGVIFVES